MGGLRQVGTVAKWEIRRLLDSTSREVAPLALVLFALLLIMTLLVSQQGLHLQHGIYRAGVSDPSQPALFGGDTRFEIYMLPEGGGNALRGLDLAIVDGHVYAADTARGRAALHAFSQDYERYLSSVYVREKDLAAAYPVWVDLVEVKGAPLALEGGQFAGFAPGERYDPSPSGGVEAVMPPEGTIELPREMLARSLSREEGQLSRFASLLTRRGEELPVKTPSGLTPPMPLDSIVLVFAFVFPLYFASQIFMMSVMNERIQRRGELLLSTPVPPQLIIAGKALPYLLGMLAIASLTILLLRAPAAILLPLLPIILFFLSAALLIGMLARSFKELSFISLFFSTFATVYLFVPTVFAHVHEISLLSPLTLVLLQLEGEAFTLADYLYSTSLIYLTSALAFCLAGANFTEERLFSEARFLEKIRGFTGGCLSPRHPAVSILLLNILLIPAVFMLQMALLVMLFNLPLPYSLVALIPAAALIEEGAKTLGIYALSESVPGFLRGSSFWAACIAAGTGFLAGEKLFLLAMVAQVTESVFGSVLFLSLQLLWYPLALHVATVIAFGLCLRRFGTRAYLPGLLLATLLHALYNFMVLGWWG